MAGTRSRIVGTLLSLLCVLGSAPSQAADVISTTNTHNVTNEDEAYSPEEIEQMVAPIALYPDSLLTQVLMAATYPLEIVEAARWRAGQPRNLSDQQLSQLLETQPWDPSVKAVVAFPDVLNMMNEQISWTGQLGDAFLNQQEDVMAAVQNLRARAQAAGNLRSGPQQVVTTAGPGIITIAPAQPETIYVPIYNPIVIYGTWPYPNYMPHYWRTPHYIVTGPRITFATALVAGGVLWSTYDWGRGRFDINVNRYNRFNRTRITSDRWHHDFEQRRAAANRNAAVHSRTYGPIPRGRGPEADERESRGERANRTLRTPNPAQRQDRMRPQNQLRTSEPRPPQNPTHPQPQTRTQQRAPVQNQVRPSNQLRAAPATQPSRPAERPARPALQHEPRNANNRRESARPPEQRQARPPEQRQARPPEQRPQNRDANRRERNRNDNSGQ
jgi:hypothetical protein